MEDNNVQISLLGSLLNSLTVVGKHFSFSEQKIEGKLNSHPVPARYVTFGGRSKLSVTTDSGERTLLVTSGWRITVKDITQFVFGGFTENNNYSYFKIEIT